MMAFFWQSSFNLCSLFSIFKYSANIHRVPMKYSKWHSFIVIRSKAFGKFNLKFIVSIDMTNCGLFFFYFISYILCPRIKLTNQFCLNVLDSTLPVCKYWICQSPINRIGLVIAEDLLPKNLVLLFFWLSDLKTCKACPAG